MNKSVAEAVKIVTSINRKLFDEKKVEIVVCPPFISLVTVQELIIDSPVELGAQDLFWEEKGAYTGEISPIMLKDIGCKYVIIGHSERRKYFGETNSTVNKKILAALHAELNPIICVGETKEEREQGITEAIIQKQITEGLKNIESGQLLKGIIAYEPIWAIGTGINASPEQAEDVHNFIRNTLIKAMYTEDTAKELRIVYGGSVKPNNIKALMTQNNIDGGLIGGASLNADDFCKIIKYYE